jgi:hypothetical protein
MLHRRRAVVGAVVVVLSSISVMGCGDGGDGKTTAAAPAKAPATTKAPASKVTATAPAPAAAPAERLTRAEYIKRADKVCLLSRGVSRRANEVVQKAFNSGSAAKAADAIDAYMPAFTAHQRDLKAIPKPKTKADDAQVLNGLIKVMDGQIQALSDESKALRQQDQQAMAQITKAQQQEVQFAEELGRQYGFKVCGRTPSAAAQS